MKALLINLSIIKAMALKIAGPLKQDLFYRGPFSLLKLAEVPEPKLPSPEWVKIKTRLCGFCGSDLNLIFLKESLMASAFTSFPAIMGHELCGEVKETGKEVHNCNPGELVTVTPMLNCAVRGIAPACRPCQKDRSANCENFAAGKFAPGMFLGVCQDLGGGFAEYMVAHQSQVFRIPPAVSAESATLVEPLAVGLQAVLDNRPQSDEKVLIIGGGVIGAMIVKSIRGLEITCHITVIEPSPFAADYVKKSGADHVTPDSVTEAAEKIAGARPFKPLIVERMSKAGLNLESFLNINFLKDHIGQTILQGGFNRVYDTVGNSSTLQAALIAMAGGGTLSLVGICNKLTFDPTPLWLKHQTIKGVFGYCDNQTDSGRKHAFELALDLMKNMKVKVDDMLTHTFPLEQYQDLIEVNLFKGKNRAIKTAIRFY